MKILDTYIAKELDNVEFLQEQICSPFQERSDTAMRLQESAVRLQNLRELREKLKIGSQVIAARKYGHVPTMKALDDKSQEYLENLRKRIQPTRKGPLGWYQDDCNEDIKQSMRSLALGDAQTAIMEAKGLK